MKKYLLCACLLFFAPLNARKPPGVQQSKTFMWLNPAFLNVAADQALWHDFMYNKPSKSANSLQIKSIYQRSMSKERIKQYFLFGCRTELLVTGDSSTLEPSRDVRAEWLGITDSEFAASMTIDPAQWQAGCSVTYHKDLKALTDISFFQDSWISIEVPIFTVTNRLNLEQSIITSNKQANSLDIVQAFKQSKWLYSKIVCERNSAGPAGLIAKFGRVYLSENHFQVAYYSIFNTSFGDGQNPAYLFDAYRGTNQHFGMGAGVNFQVLLNQDATRFAFCWFLNLEHLFMMRNKQLRTFDLNDKPWSRYMLYNRVDGLGNIPGVNILTFNTRVRPYSFVDFSTGWRVITDHYEYEVGYSLWGHGDERVELLCEFPENTYGIAGSSNTTTASQSTIAHQADNDKNSLNQDVFVPIKETDLDLSSAEAQSAINHTFYTSVGHVKKGDIVDRFFCIGGAIEYPQKNSALHLWRLWFKVGVSY